MERTCGSSHFCCLLYLKAHCHATLMHCTPQTLIGFFKDLSIGLNRLIFRSKGSGNLFEKELSSVQTAQAIRWNKKYHPFKRLKLSLQNNCQPHFCFKSFSPELFAVNLFLSFVYFTIILWISWYIFNLIAFFALNHNIGLSLQGLFKTKL